MYTLMHSNISILFSRIGLKSRDMCEINSMPMAEKRRKTTVQFWTYEYYLSL